MHELPIAENILEIALKYAEKSDAQHITSLYLVMGQFSSIIDDSIQFYWDIIAKGTIAEGAILNFKRIPASIQCLECSLRFTPGLDDFSCPGCGSSKIKIVTGNEFFLEAIDIE
jgi:hydrogenase nickel incorporation protein HypA/HybF